MNSNKGSLCSCVKVKVPFYEQLVIFALVPHIVFHMALLCFGWFSIADSF